MIWILLLLHGAIKCGFITVIIAIAETEASSLALLVAAVAIVLMDLLWFAWAMWKVPRENTMSLADITVFSLPLGILCLPLFWLRLGGKKQPD